jgi:hypothetical protein
VNDVLSILNELQEKGWTLAAIADELVVTVNAVEKWKAGDRYPNNADGIIVLLSQLKDKKRVPKKKRYTTNQTKD